MNKNLIIILLVGLLIFLSAVLLNGCNRHKSEMTTIKNGFNQKGKKYKDENGDLHSRVKELEFTNNEKSVLVDSLVSEVAKITKVKKKDVKAVKKIGVDIGIDSLNIPIQYVKVIIRDTINDTSYVYFAKEFEFEDNDVKINGRLSDSTVHFDDIGFDVDILVADIMKREKWWHLRKTLYIDAWSTNKYIKNINAQSFRTKRKKKRFALVIGGGGSWTGQGGIKPAISTTIGYKLIEF